MGHRWKGAAGSRGQAVSASAPDLQPALGPSAPTGRRRLGVWVKGRRRTSKNPTWPRGGSVWAKTPRPMGLQPPPESGPAMALQASSRSAEPSCHRPYEAFLPGRWHSKHQLPQNCCVSTTELAVPWRLRNDTLLLASSSFDVKEESGGRSLVWQKRQAGCQRPPESGLRVFPARPPPLRATPAGRGPCAEAEPAPPPPRRAREPVFSEAWVMPLRHSQRSQSQRSQTPVPRPGKGGSESRACAPGSASCAI